MNNYKVERGPDGTRWVSVEPLMKDINEAIIKMMDIDVSGLSDENQRIMDLKILGLRTVYEFMGSIITADNLAQKRETMQ